MGTKTKIAWTDHTWNPWQGCQKVSPGCLNCYMYRDKTRYGQDGADVLVSGKSTFGLPLRLKGPARVFVCSWSDFFIDHPAVNTVRPSAWQMIRDCPHLTFQILTKRPENIATMLPPDWGDGYPNVWLGVTAENQATANKRIPILLQVPAAKHFVSCEPMLGPIDLTAIDYDCILAAFAWRKHLDWVICGGESGPSARPMHPEWAADLRDQCKAAGVPFFFKQQGEWALMDTDNATGLRAVLDVDGDPMVMVGRAAAGDLLDGVESREFPQEAPRG